MSDKLRFYKIKLEPGKEGKTCNTWHFDYDVIKGHLPSGADRVDEFTLACHDEPLPAFMKPFKALEPYIAELCEQPSDYARRTDIRSVSFDYNGDKKVMGVTMCGILHYKKSNGVLVMNTPHKIEVFYGKGGDASQLIPDKMCSLLYELFSQAGRYIDGERIEQKEIFPEEKKKRNKKDTEDPDQLKLVDGYIVRPQDGNILSNKE